MLGILAERRDSRAIVALPGLRINAALSLALLKLPPTLHFSQCLCRLTLLLHVLHLGVLVRLRLALFLSRNAFCVAGSEWVGGGSLASPGRRGSPGFLVERASWPVPPFSLCWVRFSSRHPTASWQWRRLHLPNTLARGTLLTYKRVFKSGIIHNHGLGLPHGLVKHRPSPITSLQGLHVDNTVEYNTSTLWAMESGRLAVFWLRNKREIMDRNSATSCTAEVPQLHASGHTKVCGGLFHATPMPARTSPNNLTGSTGADKMDSAILGKKEPFFTTFMEPSEAERLAVERALGRFPQHLSPRLFFPCPAKARMDGAKWESAKAGNPCTTLLHYLRAHRVEPEPRS